MQDGLIVEGNRLVIPQSGKKRILERIHSSHLAITGCIRRTRECRYTNVCEQMLCVHNISTKTTERNNASPSCSRTWEQVGADLFSFSGRVYIAAVDYYSNFCEIDHLQSTSSDAVIRILKQHFARHAWHSRCVGRRQWTTIRLHTTQEIHTELEF